MNMNSRKIDFRVLVLTVCFVSTFSLSVSYSQCDNMGASASVGACAVKTTCAMAVTDTACLDEEIEYFHVNEDFPTSCVNMTDKNCNEPLAACWIEANCKWVNGACAELNISGSVWTPEKKRTTEKCGKEPG
jgi:hypothetical protein